MMFNVIVFFSSSFRFVHNDRKKRDKNKREEIKMKKKTRGKKIDPIYSYGTKFYIWIILFLFNLTHTHTYIHTHTLTYK